MTAYIKNARKILCIGRNYADHIKELANAAPSQPFFFLKPTSAVITQGSPILIPRGVTVHHELELALVIGKKLSNLTSLTKEQAIDAIDGYALALDLTARNVQDEAKKKGLPWSIAKGFDSFCPLSNFIPKEKIPDYDKVHLEFSVDGKVRQSAMTDLMIFKVPEILQTVSSVMTLEPGDIILTGTPKGVGALLPGETVKGQLSVDGKVIEEINFKVEQKPGPYVFKET